jgi:hypothetical protein
MLPQEWKEEKINVGFVPIVYFMQALKPFALPSDSDEA